MNSIAEPALEHVGRVFKMMAQKHYTIEKVFRIVQPEGGDQKEKEVRIFIDKYLEKDQIFFDIGANIGVFSLYAAIKKNAKVYAFEPEYSNLSLLKENILKIASIIMQSDINKLDIQNDNVIRIDGGEGIKLKDLAQIVYYRGHELPPETNPELITTASLSIQGVPFVFTNSAMGCLVDVDVKTG